MPSGSLGDHPILDVVRYDRLTFSPEIDGLIRQLYEMGALQSPIAWAYIMREHSELRGHQKAGNETGVEQIRRGLQRILTSELNARRRGRRHEALSLRLVWLSHIGRRAP